MDQTIPHNTVDTKSTGNRAHLQTIAVKNVILNSPSKHQWNLDHVGSPRKREHGTPKKLEIYEDPPSSPACTRKHKVRKIECGCQTEFNLSSSSSPHSEDQKHKADCGCECFMSESERKAKFHLDLMCSEEPSKEYYKMLYETTKESLDRSIDENKQMQESLDELRKENGDLFTECQYVGYLKEIIKDLTGQDVDTEEGPLALKELNKDEYYLPSFVCSDEATIESTSADANSTEHKNHTDAESTAPSSATSTADGDVPSDNESTHTTDLIGTKDDSTSSSTPSSC